MAEPRDDRYAPDRLRELLLRHTLVNRRLREAIAQSLGLAESETAAIAHLALGQAMTPGELGHALGLTSGGTTALIERLHQRGYITRDANPDDKRSSLLSATPTAFDAIAPTYEPIIDHLDRQSRALPADARRVIADFLRQATELADAAADDILREAAGQRRTQAPPPAPELWA